jgi:hypothetical protein
MAGQNVRLPGLAGGGQIAKKSDATTRWISEASEEMNVSEIPLTYSPDSWTNTIRNCSTSCLVSFMY